MTSNVVKSAGRILQILEFFDTVKRPASLMEIARALDFPQSSTSALVQSLVSLGYLGVDAETRLYLPTPRVTLLGSWIDEAISGGRIPRLMAELGEATGETIILAIANGLWVRYIHVVPATKPMRLHIHPGMTRPIAGSGLGNLLLSTYPDQEIPALVAAVNEQHRGEFVPVELPALMEELREIRRTGVSLSVDRISQGAGVVSVFLPRPAGRPPLALGIGGLSSVISAERDSLVALMRDAILRHLPDSRQPG
ncbi:IclR family transcriptional regulator [Azospirillum sp.]|uniref:IclR family transcriptional regulator n=1 Tax=Azospirillum sp. TaxID=34012 RepID=UPI002D5C2611|nr:IclR family transcriptional regulator [Azospirillum sp.]HYD64011.1 IclR family transcriptional regulator [Azospirillum sp.]